MYGQVFRQADFIRQAFLWRGDGYYPAESCMPVKKGSGYREDGSIPLLLVAESRIKVKFENLPL